MQAVFFAKKQKRLDKIRKTWYIIICEYNCMLYADVPEMLSGGVFAQNTYDFGRNCMEQRSQLIVVDASVLPDVISKVLEVKRLLAYREEKSSAAACKRVGISRSAYYKYKDCVFSYEDKLTQRIINLHLILRDEAGVLSSVLSALYALDANILTVNQNIPIDGVAGVTFSVRLTGEVQTPHELEEKLSEVEGVVSVKILSGE